MKFLLLGLGSIGRKHRDILVEMGHEVVTVDPNPKAGADHSSTVELLEWDKPIGKDLAGVIDATPCDVHAGWQVPARARFIEKPLGWNTPTPKAVNAPVMMGFCYYHLPSLSAFVESLTDVRIFSLCIVSGHDLRQWHKEDYRTRYHGDPNRGGVVNDCLPHSLYTVHRIFGDVEVVGAVTGRLSGLELRSPDTAAVLLRSTWGTPIFVLEDYLRSPRQTFIEAVTSGGTKRWEFDPAEAPQMYQAQMVAFVEICAGERQYGFPTLADGVAVQKLLDEVRDG